VTTTQSTQQTTLTSGLPRATNEADMAKVPTRRRILFLLNIIVVVFLMEEDVLKKNLQQSTKAKFD